MTPTSAEETERLRVLHQSEILDTIAERAFDELAVLASTICGTPLAAISLVDHDRQWFKAAVGMPRGETPREISFCTHAIGSPEVMQVPDALLDERFASNPLVTEEAGIRFYAGAPLIADGQHAVGTICVFDRVPRKLTSGQTEALALLSRRVVALLELKRVVQELERLNTAETKRLRESRDESQQLLAERTRALAQSAADLTLEVRQHLETEQALRQSQKQFLQAQKMEALGQLAAGIAHDFNNILTTIMGYSTLLYEALPESERDESHAAEILRATERGGGLSKQLMTLSRHQPYQPTVLDPAALIDSLRKLLRQVIGDRVLLATEIDPEVSCVKADAGQLEQVLVNRAR